KIRCGNEMGCLTSWDGNDRKRFGDEPRALPSSILRSAHAQALPQSRTCVRASRRALGALWRNEAKRQRRANNQTAGVESDHSCASPVSGLLFTGNAATPTCRAVSA